MPILIWLLNYCIAIIRVGQLASRLTRTHLTRLGSTRTSRLDSTRLVKLNEPNSFRDLSSIKCKIALLVLLDVASFFHLFLEFFRFLSSLFFSSFFLFHSPFLLTVCLFVLRIQALKFYYPNVLRHLCMTFGQTVDLGNEFS